MENVVPDLGPGRPEELTVYSHNLPAMFRIILTTNGLPSVISFYETSHSLRSHKLLPVHVVKFVTANSPLSSRAALS